MRTVTDRIPGSAVFREDTLVQGTVSGDAVVSKNTFLFLHPDGKINGNLTLKENSEVYLHGTVDGNVKNMGGYLQVFGTVNGNVTSENGETVIDAEAKVRGDIR